MARVRTLPVYALVDVEGNPQILSGVNSRGNWVLARIRGDVSLYAQGVDVPFAYLRRSYIQARGVSGDDEIIRAVGRYQSGDVVLAQVEFQERFNKTGSGNYYLAGYELWVVRFIPFDSAVVVKELGFALA